MIVVAVILVVAATVVAVHEERLASLLIVAAGVASTLAGIMLILERRLGDWYDTGGNARELVLLRRMVDGRGNAGE
ncbi:hypothetical protein [Kribbella sp. NPDC051718]|uniref:hypothetical protein n=1 Tax=Kribbella sp. NPDC051718 TaxID=3155168 RepID=UPI00343D9E77